MRIEEKRELTTRFESTIGKFLPDGFYARAEIVDYEQKISVGVFDENDKRIFEAEGLPLEGGTSFEEIGLAIAKKAAEEWVKEKRTTGAVAFERCRACEAVLFQKNRLPNGGWAMDPDRSMRLMLEEGKRFYRCSNCGACNFVAETAQLGNPAITITHAGECPG